MNKRLIAIFIITGSLIYIIYWRFFNINSLPKKDIILETEFPAKFESNKQINYLNKNGNTIQERYLTLEGYKRIEVEKKQLPRIFEKSKVKAIW